MIERNFGRFVERKRKRAMERRKRERIFFFPPRERKNEIK
jgi:hypothetical protein